MTTTAKLDCSQHKALLAQLIMEHGVATIIEDLAGALYDNEMDSRDRDAADAWAEIASGIRIAHRTAITYGPAAMGDFEPQGAAA